MELTKEYFDQVVLGLATKDNTATKTDLEKFATKADLEVFAKKTDLEGFATKADLERFATKADLEGFATKTDLIEEIRPVKQQLASIEAKVDRLSLRSSEDDIAIIKDVEKLNKRVSVVQKDVKTLKLSRA